MYLHGGFVKVQFLDCFHSGERDGSAHESFDRLEYLFVFGGDKGESDAFPEHAARTADAVGVGFGCVRDVKVDDVGNLGDVDAPGGDIRGHHDGGLAGSERRHGFITLTLGEVSLEGRGLETFIGELEGEVLGPMLGSGENKSLALVYAIKDDAQGFVFFGLADRADKVAYRLEGLGSVDLDAHGIALELAGEARNFLRHGGGEKKGLAVLGQGSNDLFDGRKKSHVEHPVSLVENEDLDRVELDHALTHEVEEAARAGNDDLGHGFSKVLDLAGNGNAAEDAHASEVGVFA